MGSKSRVVSCVAAIAALLLSACGSDEPQQKTVSRLAQGCSINSDCDTPLVCAFGRCHDACETTRDCPSDQRCMASDRPFHVCQLPEESTCSYNSNCPKGQLCGIDGQCRDECAADRDCVNGQVCAQGTCAEPAELDDDGRLPRVTPDAGEPEGSTSGGEGEPCILNSDCPASLVCRKNGLCGVECKGNDDCPSGSACVASRCVASAIDAGPDVAPPPGAPAGYGSGCDLSSDCPAPLRCGRAGRCVYECSADLDCALGQCCLGHVCATGSACETDAGSDAPACPQGDPCTPTQVCHTGAIDCSSGAAVCVDTGSNASDGTSCGANLFCTEGTCAPCTPNAICTPQPNTCHVGTTTCGTGVPVCNDTGYVAADGATCGPNMVCHGGTCGACVAGSPCTPGDDACHAGVVDCSSGLPVCVDRGTNIPNGTSCGTNMVCNAGKCVGCTAGGSCVPGNPCHAGRFECNTGAPTCVDTGNDLNDGTSCATNSYCAAGVCLECLSGTPCVPSVNPCHVGVQQCYSGVITCQEQSTNVPDGTSCPGTNAYCITGSCVPVSSAMSVASGDQQTGTIDQLLAAPIVVLVSDAGNSQPVAGAKVTLSGPPGAAISPAVATTGLNGKAIFTVRLGRATGKYTFSAAAIGVTSVTATATAVAPTAGTIFTASNVGATYGQEGVPGPATVAKTGSIWGSAIASDGTLYLSDQDRCVVYALSPAGELSVVAGTLSQCGSSGNGGVATSAKLYYPRSLALDEQAKLLYIADTANSVVRVVSLATKQIGTYAGGAEPAINSAPYGDGNSATAATLSGIGALSVGPDGTLYIADANHSRIRAVDPNTGLISTWIASGSCSDAVAFNGCGGYDGCNVLFDAKGNAFIGAYLCGSGPGSGYGIVRRDAGTSNLTWIAGVGSSGTTSDNVPARTASFSAAPSLALDAGGNLIVLDRSGHRVRRIEGGTGRITTIAGTGTYGTTGDYGPSTSAQVNAPAAPVLDASGNLFFAETGTYVVRAIWGVGASKPSTAKLALVDGDEQTVYPDQQQPVAMAVKLTDSTDAAIQAFSVSWRALDPGAVASASTSATNIQGKAAMVGRPGLALGTYRFEASFKDIHGADATGSPITFSVTAAAPPAGTIFAAVNVDHVGGDTGVPGAGVVAQVRSSYSGVTSDSAGNLYVLDSDSCHVNKLDTKGVITRIAGVTCNSSGDGGPAANAGLYYPRGIALDEANKLLYVAEWAYGRRIRVIDLSKSPPQITTYAGNGTAGASPWGNGGPPDVASVPRPVALSIGPDGALYVGDSESQRIRRIDPSSTTPQLINDWLAPSACNSGAAINLYSCGGDTGCALAWDKAGNAYITGQWCGTAPTLTTYTVTGIVKRTPNGTLSMFAGAAPNANGAGTSDGIAATLFNFSSQPGTVALDANGNVFYAEYNSHKIRRIDATTGKITTFAGTGAYPYAGDYVPASSAQVGYPSGLTVLPGNHLAFFNNYDPSLRIVW